MESLEERRLFVAYMWAAPAGGAWAVPGNWAPMGVPGAADTATIALPGAYDVALPGSTAVLALTVGDGGAGGPGLQRLTVGGSLAVAGATLVVTNGAVNFAPGSTLALRTGTLGLFGTGAMDLADNDAIVGPATPLGMVEGFVVAARNGGMWNMPGLTSSTARTQATRATSLGVISGIDYISARGPIFDGALVGPGDSLIKYTWYGDTDFSGRIDGADYARIDSTFQEQVNVGDIGGWFNGDSDLNGKVDFGDYALIDLSYNVQSSVVLRPGAPASDLFADLESLISLEKEIS